MSSMWQRGISLHVTSKTSCTLLSTWATYRTHMQCVFSVAISHHVERHVRGTDPQRRTLKFSGGSKVCQCTQLRLQPRTLLENGQKHHPPCLCFRARALCHVVVSRLQTLNGGFPLCHADTVELVVVRSAQYPNYRRCWKRVRGDDSEASLSSHMF
jgi:hypothetical protein